jgi:hypothetical protein
MLNIHSIEVNYYRYIEYIIIIFINIALTSISLFNVSESFIPIKILFFFFIPSDLNVFHRLDF